MRVNILTAIDIHAISKVEGLLKDIVELIGSLIENSIVARCCEIQQNAECWPRSLSGNAHTISLGSIKERETADLMRLAEAPKNMCKGSTSLYRKIQCKFNKKWMLHLQAQNLPLR